MPSLSSACPAQPAASSVQMATKAARIMNYKAKSRNRGESPFDSHQRCSAGWHLPGWCRCFQLSWTSMLPLDLLQQLQRSTGSTTQIMKDNEVAPMCCKFQVTKKVHSQKGFPTLDGQQPATIHDIQGKQTQRTYLIDCIYKRMDSFRQHSAASSSSTKSRLTC